LIAVSRRKYFRLLAEVMADGVNTSDALLKKGLVVPYKEKKDWCKNE